MAKKSRILFLKLSQNVFLVQSFQIQWVFWSPDAFEHARAQNKPVLLSISATWCHWCHRLDHDTLEKPAVVQFVNSHFVPIRVDTDARPDINTRYNAGGWPTVAILDSNGFPLQAGTYFGENEFLDWLQHGIELFKQQKNQMQTKNPIHSFLSDSPTSSEPVRLEKDAFTEIQVGFIETAKASFDSEFGGFGFEHKFPMIPVLEFLVFKLREAKNPELQTVLFSTLDAMQSRGLWDSKENGFFRYCTTREWSVPHYEKMLEDNARLISVFLDAFLVSQNESYKTTALQTIEYLEKNLFDSTTNCFFGSQDADESYYVRSLSERKKRKQPSVDQTVFSDWNAMMGLAYFKAFVVTQNKQFFQKATAIFDFLNKNRLQENGSLAHSGSDATERVFFKDCVWFTRLCMALYQASFAPHFLDSAQKTIPFCIQNFYEKEKKGFCDSVSLVDKTGLLGISIRSLEENMLFIECLLKLSFWKKNQAFHATAQETFVSFVNELSEHGLLGAPAGIAAVLLRDGLNETRLVARVDSEAQVWQWAFLKKNVEKTVMEFVVADSPEGESLVGKKPVHLPAAFICKKGVCLAPIFDLSAFERAI